MSVINAEQAMSDIEDGELLSSDNEECLQPLSQKEEQKKSSKNRINKTNIVDTNNNVNEQRNFHKNEDSHRHNNKKKSSTSPGSRERKRKHYNKVDLNEIKRHRNLSENREKVNNKNEYYNNKKVEIVPELQPVYDDTNSDKTKQDENNVITKRKILCKYYASGECKNGQSCVFMHEDFPCKFFHDKSTNCRAGDDCKYSHAPLAEDMKTVMESFIHEGKDHSKSNFTPASHTTNVVPIQNRTKCLLPTPVIEPQISQLSQTQFHKPVFYSDFCDPEPFQEPLINNSNNFTSRYTNSSTRTSYPINQPRLFDQDFRQLSVPGNFHRKSADFNTKNNCMSFEPVANSFTENYRNDFYPTNMAPASPPEIKFHEPPPCDMFLSQQQIAPNIPYNNHAPARFIVGNNTNTSKPIVESNIEDIFKEALKRLADTVTLPDILSNQDKIPKSNSEDSEKFTKVKPEKTNSMAYHKSASMKSNKFIPKDKNGFKSKFVTVPPGKPLQSVKKIEPIRKNSIYEEKVNISSVKQENIDYDPFQPPTDEYSPVSSSATKDRVSYSPVQPNSCQVSYSTFSQEKVSYSPIVSNIKQETVSYSPVQSGTDKVSYSPMQLDSVKKEATLYSSNTVQQNKQSTSPVQTENDKNCIKSEPIVQNIVRIADNVSIFQINENELSESERQYIEEMRSLINLDAQFESKVPWVAVKLEPVLKQPYILFSLKVHQVHENAVSDPRLVGHPVLRAIESVNDGHDLSNRNTTEAHDEDENENHENYPSVQSKPLCDTRSYLYNYKVKKESISGQIML